MKKKYTTELIFELVRKNQAELKFGLVNKNKCIRGEE